MNPLLKKAIAAVAIKEGIEKVQEMRRPKRSLWSRISPFALVAAAGGALFYLNKSGKLGPVIGQVKEKVASGGSGTTDSTSSWDSNGATPPPPSSSSSTPAPTTV